MSHRGRLPNIQDLINSDIPEDISNHHTTQGTSPQEYDSTHHFYMGRGPAHVSHLVHGQPSSSSRGISTQRASRSNHPSGLTQSNSSYDVRGARLPSIPEVLARESSTDLRLSPIRDGALSSSIPGGEGASTRPRPKKPGYPCERCGKMFGRKPDAIKHIRVVHDRIKSFVCSECGKKFARKDYCMVCIHFLFSFLFLPLSFPPLFRHLSFLFYN